MSTRWKLSRVVFREDMEMPLERPFAANGEPAQQHWQQRVEARVRKPHSSRQKPFNLWFENGFIVVEHPNSGETEYFPIAGNVKQMKRMSDQEEKLIEAERARASEVRP